ncbi:PREDICTED: uncharacterized protein LOC104816716 [Tarenaya hassleriana]|uniref:uncharacterized protein LOC104816716 n=1 Tax=Tarenaya hassleriana TaxID=28532 RepID=UPI00053C35E0|nr:PREDICTED: uncharacterized protein LOC104816716 [Tarenaya hassleriana]
MCKPIISHLSFADDIMVFLKGDLQSLREIKKVLDTFGKHSGLRINESKTELFLLGFADNLANEICSTVEFNKGTLPVRNATVWEATRGDAWNLPGARSDRIQELHTLLARTQPPTADQGPDLVLWKHGDNDFKPTFKSSTTWNQIPTPKPAVQWYSLVWFQHYVPRYAFVQWQAMHNRLPTKDHLNCWGVISDTSCNLCGGEEEIHQHLFFKCSYNKQLWSFFGSYCWPNPPEDLQSCLSWIDNPSNDFARNMKTISRLIAQTAVYELWKERNHRIFRNRP